LRACLHVVPKDPLSIAGTVYKVVGESSAIENFCVTLFIGRPGLDIGELLNLFVDLLFIWKERIRNLLSSL
jgi:hypothetical protein